MDSSGRATSMSFLRLLVTIPEPRMMQVGVVGLSQYGIRSLVRML